MTTAQLDNWVVVLDLDDTLYKERDYVISGIESVAAAIAVAYKCDLRKRLVDAYESGSKDVWGIACSLLKLPVETKESLIWMYRVHTPSISLTDEVKKWIKLLSDKNAALAILTDGRSATQRLKLAALGLSEIPAYISEEHGSEKPAPERFEKIVQRWPGHRYVYIGDNPRKDFFTPNRMGWLTLGLLDDGKNIHSQEFDYSTEYAPRHWIESLCQADQLFMNET